MEKDAILKFMSMTDKKVNCIVDLTNAGRPSSKARKIYKELIEHEKLNKFALFGVDSFAKVLSSFVMGVSRKENMRFFSDKEEALVWLKE